MSHPRRAALLAAAALAALVGAALGVVGSAARARAERAYLAHTAYAAARGIRLREPNRYDGPTLAQPVVDPVDDWLRSVTDAGRWPAAAVYVDADSTLPPRSVRWTPRTLPPSLGRALREDRALLHHAGGREIVTAPVKDKDDWDIVGAFGLVRTGTSRLDTTLYALGSALLPFLALAAAFVRADRRQDWYARALTAAAIAAIALVAWLEGRWVLADARALADRASRFGLGQVAASAGPVAQFPSSFAVGLSYSLIAFVAAALTAATAWVIGARRRAATLRETLAAWAFLSPSLLHLLLFSIGPLLFALYISAHRWELLRDAHPFVGLANYAELLRDPTFWNALRNTAVYSLYVPVTMALALGAALLVNGRLRGARWLRALMFLPYVASYVAIAIVWQWLYDFDFGLLNAGLRAVGLRAVDWLGDPRTALPAVMVVSAWVNLGYQMVIFLAGLQGIPESLHDAARLDGAGPWSRLRHVTLPLLRPVTVYVFITGVIWSFHSFTLIYVMTEGGPLHATDVVVYQIYQNAWEFRRVGYAAAMSWVLFALLFVLTLAQWRLLSRRPLDHA